MNTTYQKHSNQARRKSRLLHHYEYPLTEEEWNALLKWVEQQFQRRMCVASDPETDGKE